MKDPIKIIHKFKNNNNRNQYKVYIYIGYLIPKEIMTILKNIENSDLDLDDKIALQHLLKIEFNGNFRALIEDMMKHSIENEEYETAALIRDQLKHIEND